MKHRVGLLLLIAVSALLATSVTSAQGLDDQARAIAQGLQCPVCQGLSVADSPSQLATQMRAVIRSKLEAGESRDEIVSYFADRYGESILMEPPRRGFTALVWLAPAIGLVAAAIFVASVARRRAPDPARAPDPDLARYLDEVDRTFEQVRDDSLR